MQQQHLEFVDIPGLHENVWAHLDHEQQQAVVEVLARLMVQTIVPKTNGEEDNDD